MAQIEFYDENLDKTFLVDESELPDKSFAITKDNCIDHYYNWCKDIAKYPFKLTSIDMYDEVPVKYMEFLGIKVKPNWINKLKKLSEKNKSILLSQLKKGTLDIESALNHMLDLYDKVGIPKLKPYSDWWYED